MSLDAMTGGGDETLSASESDAEGGGDSDAGPIVDASDADPSDDDDFDEAMVEWMLAGTARAAGGKPAPATAAGQGAPAAVAADAGGAAAFFVSATNLLGPSCGWARRASDLAAH